MRMLAEHAVSEVYKQLGPGRTCLFCLIAESLPWPCSMVFREQIKSGSAAQAE